MAHGLFDSQEELSRGVLKLRLFSGIAEGSSDLLFLLCFFLGSLHSKRRFPSCLIGFTVALSAEHHGR